MLFFPGIDIGIRNCNWDLGVLVSLRGRSRTVSVA